MVAGPWACWLGRGRSGVGTEGKEDRLVWRRMAGWKGGKYGDGVDVEDGHFGWVVDQVAALSRLVECGFDEVWEIRGRFYAWHIRGRVGF